MCASAAHSSCRLLDLPEELLYRCLPDRDSLPSSWAASRQLFNACSGNLRLCLEVQAEMDWHARRATLVRVAESFSAVTKLKVHCNHARQSEALDRLLAPPPTCGPAWLTGIRDMTISAAGQDVSIHASLHSLLPHCITEACPQLIRLVLHNLTFTSHQQQQQQQQQGGLPFLQQLVLNQCRINMAREEVEQQLQGAPNLQQLKLVTSNSDAVTRLSSTMTELEWVGECLDFKRGGVCLFLDSPQPHHLVRKLIAQNFPITNRTVHKLVETMPNLEQLEARIMHFDCKCSLELIPKWKQITLDYMLDWASIARMPVSPQLTHLYLRTTPSLSAKRLQLTPSDPQQLDEEARAEATLWGLRTDEDVDLYLAAQARAVAQQVGGLQYQGDDTAEGFFYADHEQPLHNQQVLMHLVQMFSNLQCIRLKGRVHVNAALLAAISQLPTCKQLQLADDRQPWVNRGTLGWTLLPVSFESNIWDCMVSSLPHVTELTLMCSQVTLDDVKLLCSTATHPISVFAAHDKWCVDFEQVLAVEAAAQSTLVNLQIEC